MKVSVTKEGVFVDGHKVDNIIRVDVINLNPLGEAEVVLHIAADEVEIDHKHLGIKE